MGICSMTGFASVRAETPAGEPFTLTLKGVNHRFLDLHLRLPHGWERTETEMRAALKQRLRRGHVEVTLQMEARAGATARLNREVLESFVAAFREANQACGLHSEPDLNVLLRLPGVMDAEVGPNRSGEPEGGSAVREAFADALQRFEQTRSEEGAALEAVLRMGMARMAQHAGEIARLREEVRPAHAERLRERLEELLQGAAIPPERLLAEAALLADRSDIEEEIVRLQAHGQRFLAMLDSGGELGKRLDFLLQEMNRESNTLLSKTGGASGPESLRITDLGLEMKVEIERAREQVQNLE